MTVTKSLLQFWTKMFSLIHFLVCPWISSQDHQPEKPLSIKSTACVTGALKLKQYAEFPSMHSASEAVLIARRSWSYGQADELHIVLHHRRWSTMCIWICGFLASIVIRLGPENNVYSTPKLIQFPYHRDILLHLEKHRKKLCSTKPAVRHKQKVITTLYMNRSKTPAMAAADQSYKTSTKRTQFSSSASLRDQRQQAPEEGSQIYCCCSQFVLLLLIGMMKKPYHRHLHHDSHGRSLLSKTLCQWRELQL